MSEIPGLSHISIGSVPSTRKGANEYIAFRHLMREKVKLVENAWIALDDRGLVEAWYVDGDAAAKSWALTVRNVSDTVWDEVKQASRERVPG